MINTPATLLDLARAKAAFQQRTIATILTEGRDMTPTEADRQMNEISGRRLRGESLPDDAAEFARLLTLRRDRLFIVPHNTGRTRHD
jgi:hypothetical protein